MARTQDSRTPDARRSASLTQRRLTRTSRAARSQIGFSVGLGLVSTCLIIAQATLLAIVISGVFMGGESLGDVSTELIWLAAVGSFFWLAIMFAYTMQYYLTRGSGTFSG